MRTLRFEKFGRLDGPIIVWPLLAEDERGYVQKDFHQPSFEKNGIHLNLKEVFYTCSKKGTIRAIHFQTTKPQGKLIRCVKGRVYDVVVDLRIGSPTYKEWEAFELNETGPELWIPGGFGHGYFVLEESIVSYKCDEIFYGEYDSGVRWNDPDLNIQWPIEENMQIILSDKDKQLQTLRQYEQQNDAFQYVENL